MDPSAWQAIQDLGTAGLLAFALVGGYRGWYVWGREIREMTEDRDFWRTTALKAMAHTDTAIGIVERKVEGA